MSYTHHLFFCTNLRPDGAARECCAKKNSEALRLYCKAKVKELGIPHTRVNVAGCLDQCEQGPVAVLYPQGVWYRLDSEAAVDRVINEHLIGGTPVEDLRIEPKI